MILWLHFVCLFHCWPSFMSLGLCLHLKLWWFPNTLHFGCHDMVPKHPQDKLRSCQATEKPPVWPRRPSTLVWSGSVIRSVSPTTMEPFCCWMRAEEQAPLIPSHHVRLPLTDGAECKKRTQEVEVSEEEAVIDLGLGGVWEYGVGGGSEDKPLIENSSNRCRIFVEM